MVINKKYELQFNFFVCSWIDVEWRKGSWDWEMRLSNKQMEVKSIFGNVGGYISGPTSNGMTQDTSDRESAQIRRYHLVICLPRCHGNTIATSHWLNLWQRCRLNRYKVAGRRSSVRLYILFTWPYFCFMLKKKESKNQFFLFWGTSSCRSRSGFVGCERIGRDRPIPKRASVGSDSGSELSLTFSNAT